MFSLSQFCFIQVVLRPSWVGDPSNDWGVRKLLLIVSMMPFGHLMSAGGRGKVLKGFDPVKPNQLRLVISLKQLK